MSLSKFIKVLGEEEVKQYRIVGHSIGEIEDPTKI